MFATQYLAISCCDMVSPNDVGRQQSFDRDGLTKILYITYISALAAVSDVV